MVWQRKWQAVQKVPQVTLPGFYLTGPGQGQSCVPGMMIIPVLLNVAADPEIRASRFLPRSCPQNCDGSVEAAQAVFALGQSDQGLGRLIRVFGQSLQERKCCDIQVVGDHRPCEGTGILPIGRDIKIDFFSQHPGTHLMLLIALFTTACDGVQEGSVARCGRDGALGIGEEVGDEALNQGAPGMGGGVFVPEG